MMTSYYDHGKDGRDRHDPRWPAAGDLRRLSLVGYLVCLSSLAVFFGSIAIVWPYVADSIRDDRKWIFPLVVGILNVAAIWYHLCRWVMRRFDLPFIRRSEEDD